MLSEEHKRKVEILAKEYETVRASFQARAAHDEPTDMMFPSESEIYEIARRIDMFSFEVHIDPRKPVRGYLKRLLVRVLRPVFKIMMHRQIELNRYMWYLALTVRELEQSRKAIGRAGESTN